MGLARVPPTARLETRIKESLELASDTGHRPRDDAVVRGQGNMTSRRVIPAETAGPEVHWTGS